MGFDVVWKVLKRFNCAIGSYQVESKIVLIQLMIVTVCPIVLPKVSFLA